MGYNYLEFEDRLQSIVENLNESNFIYEFLSLYGLPKATISKLKQGTSNLSNLENVKYLKNKIYAQDKLSGFSLINLNSF